MARRFRSKVMWGCSAAAASGLLGVGTALAQDAADSNAGGLEEVIVAAQRRAESAQSVPISITALSGEQLEAAGVGSLPDIARVTPGLQFQAVGAVSVPFLRGVGSAVTSSGAESTVALFVDGVYMSAQPSSLTSLANVDSIEVDKGPQGTLFGRNATGGVIQIRTRRPSQDPRVEVNLGYGNYQTGDATVYSTTGVTSTLAADLALSYHDQSQGYGTNLFAGSEVYKGYDYVARSKWLWTPSDATEVTLIGDW